MALPTKVYTLNPKACSVIELYGFLDLATRDWTDGLLSNIFREINKPTDKKERRYILYDGDVDALWIENMVCSSIIFFEKKKENHFDICRIPSWMIINF